MTLRAIELVLLAALSGEDGSGATGAPFPAGARILLEVDGGDAWRSRSPASVTLDLDEIRRLSGGGALDPGSLSVLARRPGEDASAPLPHRLDRLFGSSRATLHFALPDPETREAVVEIPAARPGAARPPRFPGMVGDGDLFREAHAPREIAPSHFDHLVDFDADGDLDLFQGGVEPYVRCFENAGGNLLVDRGRLASGGALLELPSSRARRSWLTVAFHDVDGDGDQDLLPSFQDGPDSGRILLYRNVTPRGDERLAFDRVGPLATVSGVPLAGGAQAGGWFPSIVFARDWDRDGDGSLDAIVGSANRCWLYRGVEPGPGGEPGFADPVAVQAGGRNIELVNPRFDCADVDADGDLDLLAGTQPGAVLLFRNAAGKAAPPSLEPGITVAFGGKYLIGDAHSGARAADLDGDGRIDIAAGRFWRRADLSDPGAPQDFGGLWKGAGDARFERARERAPRTVDFQPCDAVRQNSVRAADWNKDGLLDLLAGDTDGFVWLFERAAHAEPALFAPGRKLRAGGGLVDLSSSGGHARPDVADWNRDGAPDLVVADGGGHVTLFEGDRERRGELHAGRRLQAGGKEILVGARSSVLACDWDSDGRRDLVLADDKGYRFLRNVAREGEPVLAAPKPVLFGGKPVAYVRPNLGSFVDWDRDGKRDLIGCHFENSVRFYRNVGSGAPGAEPEFEDPEGVTILTASSPQMISGADAVDWNGDGDLDILTGQGHGGSGLRFFERDWIEDELRGSHPRVAVKAVQPRAASR